jgi:hypothetical protein
VQLVWTVPAFVPEYCQHRQSPPTEPQMDESVVPRQRPSGEMPLQQSELPLQSPAPQAWHAAVACAALCVGTGLQSKNELPMPLEWVLWHEVPQHAGVAHSQPSVSGAVAPLQSMRPALQLYVHEVPLQLAAPVVVLHAWWHAPQLEVDDCDDSHPSKLPAICTQSSQPAWQPAYMQADPVQLGAMLCTVSQALPQAPQFAALESDVSQPFVSGGVVLQFASPGWHFWYTQVALAPASEMSQTAPMLLIVSHDLPPQTSHVLVATAFSQPLVSVPLVSQSAKPGLHPE